MAAIANPPSSFVDVQDFSQWAASNAQGLENAAQGFINDLVFESGANFENLPDPEAGPFTQWDFDTEISQLDALFPGILSLSFAGMEQIIAQIKAEVQPVAPALALPTAAIPTLDAERPLITIPPTPSSDVGTAPSDAPVLDDVAIPEAPVFVLPDVPTLESLNLPPPPSFETVSFAVAAPQNLLSPPTATFDYVDAGYTSQLRDPLVAKLLFDLENGGYGIDASDEAALFNRARDRAEQAARLTMEEAQRRAANLSFPLPTGALFADMERARRDVQSILSDTNRDITLKRADLFVENRRFTIQQVKELEQISIALYNAIQERALNSAKAVADVGIALYDASVRNFATQLDAYRTEAQVFETRVRAELTKAEVFKAQIQAESLRGEFNLQRVQLYQAQLNGIQTLANLYKTRVDAVSALTDVQRNKLEVFKARVQAFGETVRAKAAEFDAFRSAIQGETAKLEIYRTDIAAHEARLRGEELRVRTLIQGNEAKIQQYRSLVVQYGSRVDALKKSADVTDEILKTALGLSQINVAGYRARVDSKVAGISARTAAQRLTNDFTIANLNAKIETAKMRLEKSRLTSQLRVEIDKFGAKFYQEPLTATLAALNALSVKST